MNRLRRRGRNIHGVPLLDKPQGMSSNDVLQKVKCIYNADHAGHTSTLDPLVTGMPPICLGEATKFSQYLLDSDKHYRVVARLGQRTNTSGADRQIVQERPVIFTTRQLASVLGTFHGNIEQAPSMYSALEYQGKKLYEYARQGIEVPREARPVTVYKPLFIRHEGNELELGVHCSKGTYIHTIVDNLGEKLGCGTHVTYLCRLTVSKCPVSRMVALEHLRELIEQTEQQNIPATQLLDPLLVSMDSPASGYPVVNLPLTSSVYFKNDNLIRTAGAPLEGLVHVTKGDNGKSTGMGGMDGEGRVVPHRLVVEYPAQCSLSCDKRVLRAEYCRLTSHELFNNLCDVYTKSFELHQGDKPEDPREITQVSD